MRAEGAILVGGRSRRMGVDKASLPFGDERLEERLAAVMRPVVTRVRLIGRPPAEGPLSSLPDLEPGLGPLGGIHTALATAEESAVLVLGCDLPFVTTKLLLAILRAAAEARRADAVMPWPARGPVPVCALYRTHCAEPLRARLDRRELRATDFVASLEVRKLGPEELSDADPGGRALFNVNRPSDYQAALTMLEREERPKEP